MTRSVAIGWTAIPPWLWAIVLAPRLALMGLAFAHPERALRGDSAGYLNLAWTLSRHGVYSQAADPYSPETFRTPGYPAFLAVLAAAFRDPVPWAAALQCLLGALAVLLAWRWLRGMCGERGAALGACVLAADPVTLLHTPLIMTEALYLFLLVAAAAGTWAALEDRPRAGPAALSGILWGAAAMVRPISVYLPAPLCLFWFGRWKSMLAFLACAYLLPAAWTARNGMRTGHYLFSPVGGVSLLRYPAAGVESLRTGRTWSEMEGELRRGVERDHPDGFPNDAELGLAYQRAAAAILREHPFLLARYCLWGVVKILGGAGLELICEWLGAPPGSLGPGAYRPAVTGEGTLSLLRRRPSLIPVQIVYMAALAALYVLAGLGLRGLIRDRQWALAALLSLCLAYFLALSSSQGYYRYRIPMMPFLAALAARALRPGGGAGAPLEDGDPADDPRRRIG